MNVYISSEFIKTIIFSHLLYNAFKPKTSPATKYFPYISPFSLIEIQISLKSTLIEIQISPKSTLIEIFLLNLRD